MTSPAQTALLDNPIWNALSTSHLPLALGDNHARRYPPEIGPLSGIPDQSAESYEALRALCRPDGVIVLFSIEPITPGPAWTEIRTGMIHQMVRYNSAGAAPISRTTAKSVEQQERQLTAADAPAMVALAELTEPGPFRLRTMELGNFYGIFHGSELVAMAGKRMHLPGFVEVSGVCTHPSVRGRGYAGHLMQMVIDEIERDNQTVFLHAFTTNPAIRLYEALGFTIRQTFHFAVLANK